MDDQGGYRGYDLLIESGKVAVHLVHAWPADALKVVTRTSLPRDAWTHVMVTHDGSGKAAGLKIYLDGKPAELEVKSDSLKGSTVTSTAAAAGAAIDVLAASRRPRRPAGLSPDPLARRRPRPGRGARCSPSPDAGGPAIEDQEELRRPLLQGPC